MREFLALAAGFFTLFAFANALPQPDQIYGVNLGSWCVLEKSVLEEWSLTPHRLLTEPWMLPDGPLSVNSL